MKNVQIFDIQRCSMVDGPGLRTTVFFKGCNLHCLWCHNPESQSVQKQIMIHKKRCKGCGRCIKICPYHLKKCDLCGKCADYCPTGAREMVGESKSTREVFDEITKDISFYEGSAGGVTFSGGECMLQIDALEELLRFCHENKIHTAVDTAGHVPFSYFERVLPYTDLYLYDIKCADPQNHLRSVGVTNERILENLTKLSEIVPEKLLIRIPVIPGINTFESEMRGMASILHSRGITRFELLPYHRMGEHKYEDLGISLHLFDVPSQDDMNKYKTYFAVQ